LKLDTATGQTWALKGSRWEPVETEPVTEVERGPDGKLRIKEQSDQKSKVQYWGRDATGNPVPLPSGKKKSIDEILNPK